MGLFSLNSSVVIATLGLLLLCSLASWSIALFKLWHQFRSGKINREFSQRFWSACDWSEAQALTQQGSGDFARLGQAALRELQMMNQASPRDLQHQDTPHALLERALRQQMQNLHRYHERGLAELATIGSTAPFVGLFGTVWGIMHALKAIGQSGSVSLEVVAGPIGEALMTTAIGIATALPAVLAYNYFLRRLRVRNTELESFAHDVLRLALKHKED